MTRTQQGFLNRNELEGRRLQGIRMFEEGCSQALTADQLEVSRTTTSRWHRDYEKAIQSGQDPYKAMAKKRAAGRPTRMSAEQKEKLQLAFSNRRQNPPKRQEVQFFICENFSISFHKDHVGKLMHKLGIPTKKRKNRKYVPYRETA